MTDCVLTIAGSDPSGGAGVQNDLKTIAAHGLHGLCCITTVTVQNTQGIVGPSTCLDPEVVRGQIEAIIEDVPVSGVKIGLLGTKEIAAVVADSLTRNGRRPIVLDPVMRAGTGDPLLADDPLDVFGPIIPGVTVLTPNVFEAEVLSELSIQTPDQAEVAAKKILGRGPRAVVVKGGHLEQGCCTDVLVTRSGSSRLVGRRIESQGTHGSGCTFSTAIACNLARGMAIEESVARAKRFTEEALAGGLLIGRGNGPVDPLASTMRRARMLGAIGETRSAVDRVEARQDFAKLVPQVGTNIAVAVCGTNDLDQVIGLSGRIILISGRPRATGCPVPGGSSHMARMALALLEHRAGESAACMNVRYSPEILQAVKKVGLEAAEFRRGDEPEGERTMQWGMAAVLREGRPAPDAVYDLGSQGKEPMIRLLGSSPAEVVDKAMRILDALK